MSIFLFWEAFPAKHGGIIHLFIYMDANPKHIGLTALFDNYFSLLPEYQGDRIDTFELYKVIIWLFPSYRKIPLQNPW